MRNLRTIYWLSILFALSTSSLADWPQAAGPNHDWTVKTDKPVPLSWSVEKDLNIRWRLSLPETGQSGITVWGNRLFFSTMKPLSVGAKKKKGSDIVIYCVDAGNGKVLWKNAWPGRTAVIPTPIIQGNQVYISSGYGVGCRKITLGSDDSVREDYSNRNMKNHHGGVLLKGGHLYGYSDGRGWTCQNLKTGEVVWDSKKLGKGCIFYADNRLYCMDEGSGTGELASADTTGWKEHGRVKLEPQTELRKPACRIWTHPVVSNGVLYLRDQELLFAFDVKK